MPMAFLALLRRESWWASVSVGDREDQTQAAHLVLVRVGAERVAHLLRRRLLALRLHARRGRVRLALEHVAEVLRGRLLGVGLQAHRTSSASTPATRTTGKRVRTFMAAVALSVKLWRPVSDMVIDVTVVVVSEEISSMLYSKVSS